MKRILAMGNALTDILFRIENDDVLNQLNIGKGGMHLIDSERADALMTFLGDLQSVKVTGGSASNTINGVVKLGADGGFIGKLKNDEVGNFFMDDSRRNGVSPYPVFSDVASGRCSVLISPDGERTFCTYLGAASELSVDDLDESIFYKYDIFHVEGYLVQNHDLIRAALKMAKEAGLTTSIDLASYNVVEENLDFLREIVAKYVDIVFSNEEEAFAFSSKKPIEALDDMSNICDIAVVKIGKYGSLVKRANNIYKIEPNGGDRLDSTGAGDLYAAGFLYGYANDYSLDICGKIGSLLAGRVVQTIGAKMSDEMWAEIHNEVVDIVSA